MNAKLPEEKSRFATLAVQLLVLPLGIGLFCLALAGLFAWLTVERKDFRDYVNALRSTTGQRRSQQAQFLLNYVRESKRWQGIFDVTAQISSTEGRDKFLADNPTAVAEIAQVFEESRDQNERTRRYLALVLGLLGDRAALPALRSGLHDEDPDTVKNCLWALGRFRDNESALRAIELTRHPEQPVRLVAVHALGSFDIPEAHAALAASLKDRDELVRWNAAFALAVKGDLAGRDVLASLLDKDYVNHVTESLPKEGRPTPENLRRYRVAAVAWLAKLDPAGSAQLLEKSSREEPDLRVRNAAIQQLENLRKK